MTFAFWAITAGLIAAALAILIRPLLGQGSDRELGRKLKVLRIAHEAGVLGDEEFDAKVKALAGTGGEVPAPSRKLAIALAVLVPLVVVAGYQHVGNPLALEVGNLVAPAQTGNPHAGGTGDTSGPEMEKAVQGLADRMKSDPNDLAGWQLLGRAYLSMQRFADSRDAFKRAHDLAPEDPDSAIEYAEALALAKPDRRIDGEARTLIERTLAGNPRHQRALWLLGISEAQSERYAEAAKAWQLLLAELPPDAEITQSVRAQLSEARTRAGLPPLEGAPATAANSAPVPPAQAPPSATPAPAAAGGPRFVVQVSLAPELQARVSPGDAVFVFARSSSGPAMPLAVQRLVAGNLPATVELTDGMGMTPQMNLSSAEQVVVGARISKTGNAIASSGDLQVFSKPMATKPGGTVTLTISDVVP